MNTAVETSNSARTFPYRRKVKVSQITGQKEMILGSSTLIVTVGLLLAMVFGAIAALIGQELIKIRRQHAKTNRSQNPSQLRGTEDAKSRQDLVVQLIGLYSGVHSAEALTDFLNKELERRHKLWRVRIPSNGPGEIYDPDNA